jgi:hypothetical protein
MINDTRHQPKKRLNLKWLYAQLDFHKNLKVDDAMTQDYKNELIYNIEQAILREKNK